MTNDNVQQDFKAILDELESINMWFQGDDIDLDEGLKKLQRAKVLLKQSKDRLKEVENEFITIKREIESDGSDPLSNAEVSQTRIVEETIVTKVVTDDELPF